ncbi:probable root meristem growth factor 8 [Hibiscus syriacus]|uniref:probable root meristem growth factor 8 n=1 Tax=Hibiscus syriacus TaxID=106335 RepID=UPI00192091F1|nr:probable root meristem growth factor 8 [Hibiscus syriacus]
MLSSSTVVLPRKLRFTEEFAFKGNEAVAQHSISSTKKNEDVPGKTKQKEHGRRQQWAEGDYFTMDYPRVRRRRPIHNKSLPVGP